MFSRRLVWPRLAALLVAVAALPGEERNGWPLVVRQSPPDAAAETAQYAGPLVFSQRAAGDVAGLRPLYLQARVDDKETATFLYPLFTWQRQPDYREFSFFKLINLRRTTAVGEPAESGFDVWPLYFSKETGDPATTYHALFPVAGTIINRFGKDELTWYAFPLYMHSEKAGMEITTAPWPFLRFISGDGHHGFEFWPLFGHRGREGDYDRQFYLWPLFYKSARNLSEPEPTVSVGALPFYTRDTAPGYISETYGWPFFGYTHRIVPYHYDEQRYFWPFLVQGRGDQRRINRWAPIYTHSNIKGYDKTWVLWPLYRHATWEDPGIAQEKNQFLFFLYWSQTQRSLTNPAAAPAHKTHLWPLFSAWDNGAGRRQVQVLSPLEVFFPSNDIIRQLYTPLFALYRYDRTDAATSRHSLLWKAVTWRRSPTEKAFHLGPLFSVQTGVEQKRIALGNGVIGWQRRPGEPRGRFFLFDFARKPANVQPTAEAPSP
jgi:hypothetical protein